MLWAGSFLVFDFARLENLCSTVCTTSREEIWRPKLMMMHSLTVDSFKTLFVFARMLQKRFCSSVTSFERSENKTNVFSTLWHISSGAYLGDLYKRTNVSINSFSVCFLAFVKPGFSWRSLAVIIVAFEKCLLWWFKYGCENQLCALETLLYVTFGSFLSARCL